MPKILAKIAEEHGELAAELPAGDDAKVVHETADLLFHVMVGLTARRIPIERVFARARAPVRHERPRREGRADVSDGPGAAGLLAPGGGLERAIPHYEDRAEQRAMSAAVARALDDERPLIVEAGTGTGKTLAYLVPALQSGKRVVVSTGTRALQDQIARHDVPLLRAILARPFAAVVLKGVGELRVPAPARRGRVARRARTSR